MERKFYKQSEFASMLGIHRTTLWRWIKDGKIKTVVMGGNKMISATEIQRLEKGE